MRNMKDWMGDVDRHIGILHRASITLGMITEDTTEASAAVMIRAADDILVKAELVELAHRIDYAPDDLEEE